MTPQDPAYSTPSAQAQAQDLAEAGAPEIEITPAMIEAGTAAILGRLGGYDLGGRFSASRLAEEVYLAMVTARHQTERTSDKK